MAPDVTIIVPAYRAERTLEGCVASLLAQSFDGTFEVVVSASADHADDLPTLPADARLQMDGSVPRTPAAVARNRGAAIALGRLLVFTDADVVAGEGWLQALVAASSPPGATAPLMVAGSVVNGTPDSAAGTVEYLVEFLDLHPRRPARTAWHGATCNLLVPRDLWEALGPFPEDLEGGEDTLITGAARERGRFVFAPEARVTHLNRTRFRDVVEHQVMFGRFTAHLGRRGPYKLRPLVRYTPLAPVAAAGRVVSIYARVLAWAPELRRRSLLLLPGVLVTLAGWGFGLAREGFALDRARQYRRR